jgi:uncharacterized protein (TIGR01777 family)
LRIVITGGTGLLGRPLCSRLVTDGHEVRVLSRGAPTAPVGTRWIDRAGESAYRWTGDASTAGWGELLDGANVVINLAGESIASGRWTADRKARLERSRIETTRAVVAAIAVAKAPPRLLVNASAVGYYGSRGDEVLTEDAAAGNDFLAHVCVRWEAEAQRALSPRTRVALVRTGIVLDRDGGALAKMLLPFRLGAGGPLGSGEQYMSWIHRDDWTALVAGLLEHDVEGPFNATAPTPVTNAEFARALGAALHRPSVLPTPAFAIRLAFGEMGEALLLSSQRALPSRARALGFTHRYATIETALAQLVG